MILRRLWISLIGIVTVTVVILATNLIAGNEPVLGLDLQGGISVVLVPEGDASADDLIVIRDLIRDELESRGIAEPEVRVEGENIIVDLPGVKDQREALDAVDVAGIVSLRPVLQPCQPPFDPTAAPETTVPEATGSTTPTATTEGTAQVSTATGSPVSTGPDSSGPDSSGPASTGSDSSGPDSSGPQTTEADGGEAAGFRRAAVADTTVADTTEPTGSTGAGDSSEPADTASPPETSDEATTTTTEPLGPLGTDPLGTVPESPYAVPPPPPDDSVVELAARDGLVCTVGPVARGPNGEAGGFVFARGSAEAVLEGSAWIVNAELSDDGVGTFNQLASACYGGQQNCPTGRLAIVLDDEIVAYPGVNDPSFQDTVVIRGNFTESEARDLARVIDRGAFPINVNAENVQTVSPTLGQDSLTASIFAGLVGVVLVLALLFYFYHRLALVVLAGLVVWAMLIYSMSVFISETTNYALTLAGVTGIIVAIGVTVDSYVVYFERLKEEVRHGRTIRNSALRSFRATWRTIVIADFVALLAAVVLFALSVGSVRGFALYLGVTTVCDVIVFYFFTRPAVGLLADTGWLDEGDTFSMKDYA